ncbi:Phosphoenolpyruvate carboxykinase [ATP] [Posidoniimonas polymericola]|uniref:Phosphoenolpyruvate carboxykinase (ATP) n=1 Tax=Posidoniimonas polymericola TaxID=2528002 RepID=A0A5C5XSD5_9BACT|nr:phosphoenolpyruvate carboxykinase (ATP) [Posidoniimonas polymericola]TWT65431.1 Phosphoenolpyruvate carboxykinase [ATP] [Posidoniimonas polymericola]
MENFDISQHGITVQNVKRNLSPAVLYQEALRREPDSVISDRGALVAYSGAKTGRSPKDKRVVEQAPSKDQVWWGSINVPIDLDTFETNLERAQDYLNTRDSLYVVDAFAGWDPTTRLKVRVICERPYHALFMHTMLIRPSAEDLAEFGEPDVVIYNAGAFPANKHTRGMTSKTSVDVNLESRQMVILGSEYAGEMKKGVFTMMNYFMPAQDVLSMHCSATAAKDSEQSSLLFGLSGTGKTTLSADPKRRLIGDDEHCWNDDGVFNIEGGCYAKAIDLTPESEPDIFQALRFGSVLENVVYDEDTHHVDFHDTSITQNTRGAYPIEFIHNAKIPCVAGHPTDVIFLTCDAFGVLPPVSKLTPEAAMYHFISGYTAKVAGTEVGVTEPEATFSPCFGGPFLVWQPGKYAELLADKMKKHNANVWLVNTGWAGGAYGTGKRMKLAYTRAIVDAIHSGVIKDAPTEIDPIFGLEVVTSVPNVPDEILVPKNAWASENSYEKTAAKLAGLFVENFKKYAGGVDNAVVEAGPKVPATV